MGKKRVAEFTDHGAARLVVNFADGETSRTITGYSPVAPMILAIDGSIGQVIYNESTHLFRVPVMAGSGGSATIRMQKPQHGRRHNVSAK